MKSSEAFTVKYYTGTSIHRKCVTLPQVQTQVGIKGKSTAFSLCDNVYMRVCNCARTVSRHTCAALSLHLCVTVILWAPEHGCPLHPSSKNQPLSPAVFASWSKPLPCRCFFWCCGTMGPVEVLSSSSIQFYKGQASPPFTGGMGRVRTWQGPGRLLPSVLLALSNCIVNIIRSNDIFYTVLALAVRLKFTLKCMKSGKEVYLYSKYNPTLQQRVGSSAERCQTYWRYQLMTSGLHSYRRL